VAARGSREAVRPAPRGSDLPTLATLTDTLSAVILDVLTAPDGLDVPVAEVVIYDSADPAGLQSHDVVLAVGVRDSDRAALKLLAQAGAADAAAVVVKLEGEATPQLLDAAEDARVALFGVRPETAWGQLHALLRTAVASAGEVLQAGRNEAPAGDLFALANAVAAMVGGPVTIEDPQSRVLAYSNLGHPIDDARRQTILGRRVPEQWIARLRDEGVFSRLWSSDAVISYQLEDLQERMAIAVRAGGEILGSIWAADGGKPFEPGAAAAMVEAASIAALHFVRHRVGDDLQRRMRGELLRSLLEGRGPLDVVASRLGIEPDTTTTVVAFELTDGEEAAVAMERERVLSLVATYCEAFRRRVAQVSLGRTIYALLPSTPGADAAGVRRLATDVVERTAASLSVRVLAAIGSTVDHLGDVPRSRAEADRVLRVLARERSDDLVASIDDVRSYAVLLELTELVAERPHMASAKLAILAQHDADHETAYIETLRAYLDSFGDVVEAAQRVHVHPNTFRYRLRRLVELSGLELTDPDERLVTELQLRVL
jgi:DNA-binding PucR family transcriptional regulator